VNFEFKFSESQPRDERGRWTDGGGSTSLADHAQTTASTFGSIVGATATAALAAAVLGAALKRPKKINPSEFVKFEAQNAVMKGLLKQALGRNVLTDADRKVIQTYSQGESTNLNKKLRQRAVTKFDNPHLIQAMDKAIAKTALPTDMRLYRGVPKEFAHDFKPGEKFVDPGFGSTSVNDKTASYFAKGDGVLLHILAPKGHRGLPLDGHSSFEEEHEVLLPRNTTYHVVNRQGRNVYAELI
jgi:hypothetical protein